MSAGRRGPGLGPGPPPPPTPQRSPASGCRRLCVEQPQGSYDHLRDRSPPAVSVEGAVAYVEDLDGAYRGDVANPSRIVVVEPDGTSVPWTRGADVTYVTAAWAGSTLLAYTVGEGEHLSVLAFDGSGEARVQI